MIQPNRRHATKTLAALVIPVALLVLGPFTGSPKSALAHDQLAASPLAVCNTLNEVKSATSESGFETLGQGATGAGAGGLIGSCWHAFAQKVVSDEPGFIAVTSKASVWKTTRAAHQAYLAWVNSPKGPHWVSSRRYSDSNNHIRADEIHQFYFVAPSNNPSSADFYTSAQIMFCKGNAIGFALAESRGSPTGYFGDALVADTLVSLIGKRIRK
jgi:hypothetical protein